MEGGIMKSAQSSTLIEASSSSKILILVLFLPIFLMGCSLSRPSLILEASNKNNITCAVLYIKPASSGSVGDLKPEDFKEDLRNRFDDSVHILATTIESEVKILIKFDSPVGYSDISSALFMPPRFTEVEALECIYHQEELQPRPGPGGGG